MGKKREFKPDKQGTSFWYKLYLTKKQRAFGLKWSLYALVLLTASVVQDVILCRTRFLDATSDLVPCAIFLICLLEGSEKGSIFALVSACLYHFSGTAPGVFAIPLITGIALAVTIFRQSYLQKGFGTALLCVAVAMLLYELSTFGLGLFLNLTRLDRLMGFGITAALSMIAVPILYPILLSIGTIGGQTWNE